eukprot:scaffold68365_cov63-Phaeocystis_antarctica.AAC.2
MDFHAPVAATPIAAAPDTARGAGSASGQDTRRVCTAALLCNAEAGQAEDPVVHHRLRIARVVGRVKDLAGGAREVDFLHGCELACAELNRTVRRPRHARAS